MAFDVSKIRALFPILSREIDGNPLIYLDNAATTQKPQAVIDAIVQFYSFSNANVHRGAHTLSDESTRLYEDARDTVCAFINAADRKEVIWTSGTTEAINLVANGLAQRLSVGDEVVVSELEHHANLVTWQQACLKAKAKLVIAPINEFGEIELDAFSACLNSRTKLVAFPHVSNALGTLNPIKKLTELAKRHNALVLIDGAQGIAHEVVNVQEIGCDFYVFSGHKLYGPTGIGVLWGKAQVLETWPVWLVGGEMISTVTYQQAVWGDLPNRLEAGTPNMAGAIGLGAAIKWLSEIDLAAAREYEIDLLKYATSLAKKVEGLSIVGDNDHRVGVLSFNLDGIHSADIGFLLDKQNIAIRTGDHCAQPLMQRLGVSGTARASFSLYNTHQEIDKFFQALEKAKMMLA